MKVISHPIFLKHKLEGHIENPERIKALLKRLKYEKASNGEAYLTKIHTKRYVTQVKKASESKKTIFLDNNDTYCCKDTYEAACYAVGAAVKAAENAKKGVNSFALVRPPGHHAHPDYTGGFCVFNNIAVAAATLLESGEKVLIIDIDIHRGDGTQHCVKKLSKTFSNSVYFLSINQQGIFPGSTIDEGPVRNIYLNPGTKEDEYISALRKELQELQFKPTVVAISAGFDSFKKDADALGAKMGFGLQNSAKTIIELKKMLKVPFFAVLEGGYDPSCIDEGLTAFLKE